MKKTLFSVIFLTLITLLLGTETQAQNRSTKQVVIKGQVISSDDKDPLPGASVVLNAKDSTLKNTTGYRVVTNGEGEFQIVSRELKNEITISYLGYNTLDLKVETEGKGSVVNLGKITLELSALGLDEVTVIGKTPMAKVVADTTEYNASSFKTNPDATAEDLIKKIPGASPDGKTVGGKSITRILVNGKERFENDPSLALKSLPSDAVESIKVFDDRSEDSKFSGFDDGTRVTTLNIITKPGVDNSANGRVTAGYGSDERNIVNGNVNIFTTNHSFAIMGQSHNIGPHSWSVSNQEGGGMSFRGMSRGGGGMGAGDFRTSAFSEVNRRSSLALSYSGMTSEKFKIDASYRYGNSDGESGDESTSENLTTPRYTTNISGARSIDNTHFLSTRIEWTPTPKNRINIRSSASYGGNSGNSTRETHTTAGKIGSLISDIQTGRGTKYDSFNGSIRTWWLRSLGKPGRTMSLGGELRGNRGLGDNRELSFYETLDKFDQVKFDTINRIGTLITSGYNASGSLTLNERLGQYSQLSVNYSVGYNRTFGDKKGWNWDEFTSQYNQIDAPTTSDMLGNNFGQTIALGYSYSQENKIVINANAEYRFVDQYDYEKRPDTGIVETSNFFKYFNPSASIRYTPKVGHNFNLRTAFDSNYPSSSQLQDILDVTNPMNVRKGNPNLTKSRSPSVSMSYNRASVRNFNFNIGVHLRQTDNFTASNRRYLTENEIINGIEIAKGAQYITYVNLDGMLNTGASIYAGVGIEPLKGNVGVNLGYNHSTNPSMENNIKYLSNTNNTSAGVHYTSNISEKIDFTLRYNTDLSLRNVKGQRFDRIYNHRVSGNFDIYLTPRIFASGSANWSNQFGTDDAYSRHFITINSAVGYKLFNKRQGEIKFQAFDILNQSQTYTVSMSDTFITTNYDPMILRKFFIVSFSYKFDTRKTPAPRQGEEGEGSGQWNRGQGRGIGSGQGRGTSPIGGGGMGGGRNL